MAKRLAYGGAQLAFVGIFVVLWQWAATSGKIDTFFLGEPRGMWRLLREWSGDGSLVSNLWVTTHLVLLGFLVGLAIGAVLGCLLHFSRFFHDVFGPYLTFFNACPRIILYPFLVVWLGFGMMPKVVTIVLVMVPTVAINIAAGFKDIDNDYVANIRALGATRFAVAKNVYAPSLGLWLLATSRVTFGFAFQAGVVAEVLGSKSGLGFLILEGQTRFKVDVMFASMVILVLLALVVDFVLSLVERRATRWMPSR